MPYLKCYHGVAEHTCAPCAYERGKHKATAEIVAYLRARADGIKHTHSYPEANAANSAERDTWEAAADAIESGEHVKAEDDNE